MVEASKHVFGGHRSLCTGDFDLDTMHTDSFSYAPEGVQKVPPQRLWLSTITDPTYEALICRPKLPVKRHLEHCREEGPSATKITLTHEVQRAKQPFAHQLHLQGQPQFEALVGQSSTIPATRSKYRFNQNGLKKLERDTSPHQISLATERRKGQFDHLSAAGPFSAK